MKNLEKKLATVLASLFAVILILSCSNNNGRKIYKDSKTPVERYGALSVSGTHLCDADGKPVQLCGMSSH
ncbi:MAG: glycoside hydrolase family 5 protein, partial [Spirochaetaceae bacterium]|nr:glycoside hydrolase family 5 protein [Spirochaetaceae bacterium]